MVMHTRSSTIIAAGAIVAVLGAVMVFAYARSVSGQTAGVPTVPAWVATSDIPAGTPWEQARTHLDEQRVPETMRPGSAVTDTSSLDGLLSVRPISSGEVLTTSQFGAERASPVTLEVPPGRNGVTLNVGVPQGVARHVGAGDLVNVYVSFKGAEDTGTVTKLMLSNVQVLAAGLPGSATAPGATGSGEVLLTLALTPDDAERAIFAKENGSLWIGLVNPTDPPAVTTGRSFDDVLN